MEKKAYQARNMIRIPGGGKYGRLISKLKQGDAFTLMEMLLTVAIIAVLVAISIPMVAGSLERVRVATDAANERVARSAAMAEYLTEGTFGEQPCGDREPVEAYYDAAAGKWMDGNTGIVGYGQCRTTHGHDGSILHGVLWKDDAAGELVVYLRWDPAVESVEDFVPGPGDPGSDDPDPGETFPDAPLLPPGLCGGCEEQPDSALHAHNDSTLTGLVGIADGSSSRYLICTDCRYVLIVTVGGG